MSNPLHITILRITKSILLLALLAGNDTSPLSAASKPNILIAISDDQSFPHTSFAGYSGVSTPNFDRIAQQGVYFENAFAASPGCSPSRAAFLTGRHTWQLEEAGTHASGFPLKYKTFMELLAESGYATGFTGKGWGPGNFEAAGRTQNPAGPEFGERRNETPTNEMTQTDYAGNFGDFLAQREDNQPFVFWYGAKEPHRAYAAGSRLIDGKPLEDFPPPPFLPDLPEVRSDIADYCKEIEWFDEHLGRMIQMLEAQGELENTLILVTSDNGMPFPRAKANVYEYGIHVPLAIMWNGKITRRRRIEDPVGFVDLTATFLEAAGVDAPKGNLAISGKSILDVLLSDKEGVIDPNSVAYAARERHSSSRYQNLSYSQRAIRTHQYLYIRNFTPERWPAGDPVQLNSNGESVGQHSGYTDIDPAPSLSVLITGRNDPQIGNLFKLAVDKRPAEELYDIREDPGCLHNLAGVSKYEDTKSGLRNKLLSYLEATGDPRVLDGGDIWETYPRYSRMRSFPAPTDPILQN